MSNNQTDSILQANTSQPNQRKSSSQPINPPISQSGQKIPEIKNKEKENFVNSEKFIVVDTDQDNIFLENDTKKLTVEIKNFQLWFHVAYCITAHKSQGQTINVPYTIHDWNQMS